MAAYLSVLADKHSQLTLRSLCKSAQGRDVWAAEIGSRAENASVVVCAATPQANEMGNWACRAVLDFLLGESTQAQEILRRHRVCVVPHPNPDGTALGYIASDALGNFVFFQGARTIGGDPNAPREQVALWDYLRRQNPWLYIEWHSNHWDWRQGHMLLRYERELLSDERLRAIWREWDRRLDAMPNTAEEGERTSRTTGYNESLGLGVATQIGGIPAMIKVHDMYPLDQTLDWVVGCFCAATDAFAWVESGRQRGWTPPGTGPA